MKKLLYLSACVFLMAFTMMPESNTNSSFQNDEKYKVIKVNGQIVVKKSGKQLTQGDELLASTPLDFKTSDSRAAVISPSKGRFVLTASGTEGKTNMIPGMNNVASRSGALLNLLDLQNHFTGDYVVLDQSRLKISKEAFPMNDRNFFFIEYEYKGERIPKKLDFEGDTLIINRKDLFTIDGKPVDVLSKTSCTLKYRKSESNQNLKISTFNGVFPNLDELKKEIDIISNNTQGKKPSEQFDEIQAYITEFYGKTDKDNLKRWLK